MPKISAIIVAAGTGERFKEGLAPDAPQRPKQYEHVDEKAILWHACKPFIQHPEIDQVICVIHSAHAALYYDTMQSEESPKLHAPVIGGASRQKSVYNALDFLADNNPPDYVLIHDAARPLVKEQDITKVIDALTEGEKSVSLAQKASDTYRRASMEGGKCFAGGLVKRDNLFAIQTPQGFDYASLLDAHLSTLRDDHTDDTSIMSEAKHQTRLVSGRMMNLKLTTLDDFHIVEKMLTTSDRKEA